ncbi:MAG: CusA/CzcA family heavy metal efflux RND transporter [Chloroherpetonaceae bacterium]|nr:CusA/CzcA family heavy metal efflux RND transporter [Chloroherpetonaceae bacterium]
MLEKIIRFSLTERLMTSLIILALSGYGIYSLNHIPIDSLPDVTNNQVQIITQVKGLSPEEVEKLVTFPLEISLNGMLKTEEIRSVSKFGLSVITVVFKDEVDKYFARQMVSERILHAKSLLPPEADQPIMGPLSSALGEIYQYEIKGEGKTLYELRSIQDYFIKPILKNVEGVTEVNSFGGYVLQFQIVVNPAKLRSYGVSLDQVFRAVEKNNSFISGNFLDLNDEQFIIRGLGQTKSLQELGLIAVGENQNVPILLKDIAEIKNGEELRQGAVTRDSRGEVVTGIVMMRRGENSREVIERLHKKVQELNQQLKLQGILVESFYDQTNLVRRTLKTVITNLTEGGLLVVLVLVALVGNLRAALIVASVIPVSMLFTFIGMKWAGLSANLMSLGAIDFGMVVDGSVVVMENIVRKVHHHPNDERRHIIFESVKEVARPIFFGVLIIIAVYIPILSLQGMEGKLFSPMAYAVGFAVFGSLFLALTYIPLLSSIFLNGKVSEFRNKALESVTAFYGMSLKKVFQFHKATLAAALLLLAFSIFLLSRMGGEFIPELDEGNLLLEIKRLPSISLKESVAQAARLETIIKEFPEVKTVVSKTGRPDIATDFMGVHETDMFVILHPMEEWKSKFSKAQLVEAISTRIEPYSGGMYINFSQPIQMRVNELISGAKGDIAIKIFGEDFEKLKQISFQIESLAKTIQGTENILIEQVSGQPYMNITFNRDEMARFGVTIEELQRLIETGVAGKSATEVIDGPKRIGVFVRLTENARNSSETIGNIMVPLGKEGKSLPLKQFVNFQFIEGPAQISHETAMRRMMLEINLKDRDIVSYVAELEKKIAENVPLETGYFISYGGQFENQARATSRLMIVVPLSILLIMILLYFNFKNLGYVFLVLANLPFAIIGGVFALWIRSYPISVTAIIGFIALFGVAVLNGVVLVSYLIQKNEHRDEPLDRVIINACKVRLRPVLTTALVASLGFIPMAVSNGAGAEVQKPLATVVIGGLISSTLLTLYVLPIFYRWYENKKGSANSPELTLE